MLPSPLLPFYSPVRVRVRDTMIAAGASASLATRRSSPSLAGPSCSCSGRPVRALGRLVRALGRPVRTAMVVFFLIL